MRPIKIKLTEEDFRELIEGHVVVKKDLIGYQLVEIIVEDFGFGQMLKAFTEVAFEKAPIVLHLQCDCGRSYSTQEELIRCQQRNHK